MGVCLSHWVHKFCVCLCVNVSLGELCVCVSVLLSVLWVWVCVSFCFYRISTIHQILIHFPDLGTLCPTPTFSAYITGMTVEHLLLNEKFIRTSNFLECRKIFALIWVYKFSTLTESANLCFARPRYIWSLSLLAFSLEMTRSVWQKWRKKRHVCNDSATRAGRALKKWQLAHTKSL